MTRIRKGVITAAGRGTRQYPASQTVQKELFPWWTWTATPSRPFSFS